jgi:hypothetical protein
MATAADWMMDEAMSKRQVPIGGVGVDGPVGGGFGGFGGFPGFGGGLNVDVAGGGGLGLPGLGLLGGGFPGWGTPYIPYTPLGALEGLKGDLLVPMATIGVAVFLLVIIVIAVKAALAWKLSVLQDIASGPKKWRRDDAASAAAPQLQPDYMKQLTKIVTSAIYSGGCNERMICEAGVLARGNAGQLDWVNRIVGSYIPAVYKSYLDTLLTSAKGNFDCAQQYPCNKVEGSVVADQGPQSVKIFRSVPSTTPLPHDSHYKQPQTPRPKIKDLYGVNANSTNAIKNDNPKLKLGKFRRHV